MRFSVPRLSFFALVVFALVAFTAAEPKRCLLLKTATEDSSYVAEYNYRSGKPFLINYKGSDGKVVSYTSYVWETPLRLITKDEFYTMGGRYWTIEDLDSSGRIIRSVRMEKERDYSQYDTTTYSFDAQGRTLSSDTKLTRVYKNPGDSITKSQLFKVEYSYSADGARHTLKKGYSSQTKNWEVMERTHLYYHPLEDKGYVSSPYPTPKDKTYLPKKFVTLTPQTMDTLNVVEMDYELNPQGYVKKQITKENGRQVQVLLYDYQCR